MASNSDTGTCLMRTDVPELVKSVGDAMMAQLRKVTPARHLVLSLLRFVPRAHCDNPPSPAW